MPLLLGFDFGTSYFKVGLFDSAGRLHGLGRVAVNVEVAPGGRRELATATFWQLVRQALDEALRQASARPVDVAGVSYASQANTFLLLDDAGAELTPLILWNDRRAEVLPPDAAFSSTDAFQRAVGFRDVAPESAVTKCRWWQRERRAEWRRARRFMTLSDYFTWTMTGLAAGDASTAALLGMYHLGERRWWSAALEHFEVAGLQLATPLTPGSACGTTTAEAMVRLGLPPQIPFAVGALDHHAAAIGAGVGTFADASLSTGTVLAALSFVAEVEPVRGCFHGSHVDGTRYYRLAFDPRGAGELEEFQRQHAPSRTLEQLVHAALGDDPPTIAPGARDASERREVRTILNRIAAAQRELLHAILPAGQTLRAVAASGGGARNAAWLDHTARLLGVEIIPPTSAERACLGAAIFAAAAAKIHPSVAAAMDAMIQRPPTGGAAGSTKLTTLRSHERS
jgi:sugar (pentulose or hexulose) kinase